MPKKGKDLYVAFAAISFVLFSFVDSTHAQSIMTISGGCLLLFNCYGIFKLRKELSFKVESAPESQLAAQSVEA